jgi:hypothetical protein
MNNIGVGIFCFGDDFYYKGAIDKINHFLAEGFHCYILTEDPSQFTKYSPNVLHIINYDRSFKSYHDKMILPKHVLKNHDYCLLIDADTHITDYSFIDNLKTYEFKNGISYIDTLKNHAANREFVKELMGDGPEWVSYKAYAEKLCPSYGEFETIWEHFLIINKRGFNQRLFYNYYEKLQISKEFSDLYISKPVNGPGEGISIAIASKVSETEIQKDIVLFGIMKDKLISISRKYIRPELWPDWMK